MPSLARLLARLNPEQRATLARLRRPALAGTLRRTRPLSERYGFDRGTPVDRYYIEKFLMEHRSDIRGRALEVKNANYLQRFGVGVERCDVLDVDPANPDCTLVADLSTADQIVASQFDCFVLTQTLHLILNIGNAVRHAHRIIRPGGVLLATLPAVSRIDRSLAATDYWRVTPASCHALFGPVFGDAHITIHSYGNVLTATAFLMGMAAQELSERELNEHDPAFPVLLAVRGVKR